MAAARVVLVGTAIIRSDTESADFKATSVATTTTTAAASDAPAPVVVAEEAKKSKRLPSLSALFKRINERDAAKKKDTEMYADDGHGAGAPGDQLPKAVEDAGDGNVQPKEDKQLVYAELVLKPAENNEPPASPKNSTEYAEIVYVQKPTTAEQPKK